MALEHSHPPKTQSKKKLQRRPSPQDRCNEPRSCAPGATTVPGVRLAKIPTRPPKGTLSAKGARGKNPSHRPSRPQVKLAVRPPKKNDHLPSSPRQTQALVRRLRPLLLKQLRKEMGVSSRRRAGRASNRRLDRELAAKARRPLPTVVQARHAPTDLQDRLFRSKNDPLRPRALPTSGVLVLLDRAKELSRELDRETVYKKSRWNLRKVWRKPSPTEWRLTHQYRPGQRSFLRKIESYARRLLRHTGASCRQSVPVWPKFPKPGSPPAGAVLQPGARHTSPANYRTLYLPLLKRYRAKIHRLNQVMKSGLLPALASHRKLFCPHAPALQEIKKSAAANSRARNRRGRSWLRSDRRRRGRRRPARRLVRRALRARLPNPQRVAAQIRKDYLKGASGFALGFLRMPKLLIFDKTLEVLIHELFHTLEHPLGAPVVNFVAIDLGVKAPRLLNESMVYDLTESFFKRRQKPKKPKKPSHEVRGTRRGGGPLETIPIDSPGLYTPPTTRQAYRGFAAASRLLGRRALLRALFLGDFGPLGRSWWRVKRRRRRLQRRRRRRPRSRQRMRRRRGRRRR